MKTISKKYIPHSCGEAIGLGHITDHLTLTAEETTDRNVQSCCTYKLSRGCGQMEIEPGPGLSRGCGRVEIEPGPGLRKSVGPGQDWTGESWSWVDSSD